MAVLPKPKSFTKWVHSRLLGHAQKGPGPGPAQWQLHSDESAGGLLKSCGETGTTTGSPEPGVVQPLAALVWP
jgi:hypothetical protein